MRLEIGKNYRARNGKQMVALCYTEDPRIMRMSDGSFRWAESGAMSSDGREHDADIISEWHDPAPTPQGTTRTRLVTEIVPGNYGSVTITHGIGGRHFIGVTSKQHDATELRAAAAVLVELADALEASK